MLFLASKTLDWLLDPLAWFLILQSAALLLLWRHRIDAAKVVLGTSIVLTIILTQLPIAESLIRPLEQSTQAPGVIEHIDGIIVLGGALDPVRSGEHGKPQLNGEAERLTEFIELARRHPSAKLVFTGGSSDIWGRNTTEADVAKAFFAGQGLDPTKIVFEEQSRNTAEHPYYVRALVKPQPGERWVLITSASHMPRAYGVFRKAGWDVIPYPVSYRASPEFSPSLIGDRSVETLQMAIHEWVGRLVYYLSGRL